MSTMGAESDDDAYLLYKESSRLLNAGGFNLRKLITNSNQLQESTEMECFSPPRLLSWRTSRKSLAFAEMSGDHFVVDDSNMAKGLKKTERCIVSVGRFYDPLG